MYAGYVDDPRNTDEVWMETTALHFHIRAFAKVTSGGRDDACAVKWQDITTDLSLYGSHADWVNKAATMFQTRGAIALRAMWTRAPG